MKMRKEKLRNIGIVDFVLWMLIFIILKIHRPEFAHLSGLISAITKRDITVILYIPVILSFMLISCVIFICGLYIVYDETIGRIVRVVRSLLGKYELEKDNYSKFDIYYNKVDLMIIAIYILGVLPIMLYIVFPALTAVMVGIFILYLILQLFG